MCSLGLLDGLGMGWDRGFGVVMIIGDDDGGWGI